jgi:tRNA pseudouridine38-40 synthase
LPRDIAVLDAAEAPDGFHATLSAKRKRYRYVMCDGPVRDVFRRQTSWHCPWGLDAEAMHRAGQALSGTHDFSSFETQGSPRKTSVRTIYDIQVRRGEGTDRNVVTLEVEADGFLYNMVRTIVGTLVRVGRRARPESWVAEVLAAADRRVAGPTAPPQGLVLVRVEYD